MTTEIEQKAAYEELKEKLSDREWRLNNLYYIKDKNGNKVVFKMNEVQKDLYKNLWFFNIVPKARQLGVTTFFCIFYLDQILFSNNKTCTIIAHREQDMKKIFRNKIRFAWDHLPEWLKAELGSPDTNTANQLTFQNGSSISVSLSSRSDTVQYLHISEFGYICAKFPEKAEEIVTGAINAVHQGNFVSIESTAAGQEGYFHKFCMDAERREKEGRDLSPTQFKLHFYAWYNDEAYKSDPSKVTVTKEHKDYFNMLKTGHGVRLTDEQKAWYIGKAEVNGEKMYQEYPSTLQEAFQVSLEGVYFKKEMDKMYLQNRVTRVPHDPMLPVDVFWDLGMNDFNVLLLTQFKNKEIRFIDMHHNSGEGLAYYYNWLVKQRDDKEYRYRMNYVPHDIAVRELGTGVSRLETLYQLGMRNVKVGGKMPVQDGINRMRAIFPKFWIDAENCERLATALFNYRREFDHKLGVTKNKPRHDENSHFVDPVRLLAQEYREPAAGYELYGKDINEEEVEQSFYG